MNRAELPGWLRGSEMGELIFDHDWNESGLGPISTWPQALKFTVNIILLMPTAVLLLWGPKCIQIYNDRYRDLMGVKHPEGLGQPTLECWAEVGDFLAPICEGVLLRRESFIFENQPLVVNRTGALEEAFFNVTYSPVPDDIDSFSCNAHKEDDIKAGVSGIFVNVSETTEVVTIRALEAERARLKEALQAKRIQLLEEVFRNAPSFLHVLKGPELVFELANDAFYQLVGHRELLGRPILAALPEMAGDSYLRRLTEVRATGRPFMGFEQPVTVIPHPDQIPEERFIDVIYLPLFDEDGSCQHVLGHGIDVTEHVKKREKAEEALRESENRFRQAVEIETVGIVFLNSGGRITEANNAFLEMAGFTREEEESGGVQYDLLTPPEWGSNLAEGCRRTQCDRTDSSL